MRIGILGGGQLARMMVFAGLPLGFSFRIYCENDDEATRGVTERIQGSYADAAELRKFAVGLDAVTFEFENIPAATLKVLSEVVPIFPSAYALEVGQDRAQEKGLFKKLGIPTTEFSIVESLSQLREVAASKQPPFVIKTTRLGYDGKGQLVYRDASQLASLDTLGKAPYIVENLVPFTRELSIIGARARNGEIRYYPLVENQHHHGILKRSMAPAIVTKALEERAQGYFQKLASELDYCGVLAIEFFVENEDLIANEIAPRVHNSGHWTIDGSVTSQFENHLRAIANLPLGDTAARGASIMLNCVGSMPKAESVIAGPGIHLHDYGKSARPRRKVGHINVVAGNMIQALALADSIDTMDF